MCPGLGGAHESHEVGLDLPVDVVGVRVVVVVPRGGGAEPGAEVLAPGEVGVVERELGPRERLGEGVPVGVDAVLAHRLQERHLDIEIVLCIPPVDHLGVPLGEFIEWDGTALVPRVDVRGLAVLLVEVGELFRDVASVELGGESPGYADHLTKPGALDLVADCRV